MTSRHSRGRQLFLGTIDGDFHPRKPVKVWKARDNDGDDVLYVPGHLVIDQAPVAARLAGVTPCDCAEYRGHEWIYHVQDVRDVLDGLADGDRAVVSPMYGLMSCQAVMPTDDPERAPQLPAPPPAARSLGRRIRVAVIDTGRAFAGGVNAVVAAMNAIQGVAAGAPALQAFLAENPDRDELVDPRTLPGGALAAGGARLAWAAGHGQFVANLIKQVAPGVTIRHYGACSPMGFEREIEVAAAVIKAADDGANIINLSWCAFPLQHPQVHPPILIRHAVGYALDNGVAVVAAAGNAGSPDPTYPAVYEGVLSVGGLDRSGQRAYWSNYGDWVDVWAQSEHLWAEYVAGEELEENDPDGHIESWKNREWASWSGTSFATALVSGQLAILMAATGQRGPEAITSLKRTGYPVNGVAGGGKRIPVYLPYQYLP
jgi:subtilisin family serine protease